MFLQWTNELNQIIKNFSKYTSLCSYLHGSYDYDYVMFFQSLINVMKVRIIFQITSFTSSHKWMKRIKQHQL